MRQYIKPSMTIIDLANEMPIICASSPEITVKPGNAEEGVTPMTNGWSEQVPWDYSDDE